ncbi:hypothetical protein CANINC_001680 [Pichia inconspicua]|uniref:Major facilitator superfamily (MFS) profile domain-containing protein n=1 Tax=Pichia inconspicua TaxID=52247 RepID=A0A4T0X4C2_9ASCO|nr:hypothetical protein CANINC_001680 [[Candida] inconspicua]
MAKKHHTRNKRKVIKTSQSNFLAANHLLGSSADTNSTNSDHFVNNIVTGKPSYYNVHENIIYPTATQAYNLAALNDDIVEEAALLESDQPYDGEAENMSQSRSFTNSVNSFHSEWEYGTNSFQSTHNSSGYDADAASPRYSGSILSEVSDSLLLIEERDRHAAISWYKRPSILMISTIMFLYTFSIGISMSADLKLTTEGVCYLRNHTLENCDSPEIQQLNASLLKWNTFISSFIKILVSAKMGKMSDIYGRKPLIIFVFIMTALSKLSMVFILTPKFFSFYGVILGNAVDSLGGSIFVLLGLANSYTIDVVNDHERLQALGKLTGALFLGLSLGPLTSSFLGVSFHIPNIQLIGLAAFLTIVSLIVLILFVPESRGMKLITKSRRASVRSRREMDIKPTFIYKIGLSPFFDSFQSLKLLWITRPKITATKMINVENTESHSTEFQSLMPHVNDSKEIDMAARINTLLLLIIEILVNMCSAGASLPIALYLIYQYHFDQAQLGLFVGVASGMRSMVLTLFNPWFQKKLLLSMHLDQFNVDFIDLTSIFTALVSELVAALFCSFTTKFYAIIIYVIFAALSSIASPVIHSTLLKYNANPGKNGEFFGALALIRNLMNLIAPWLFLSVYSIGVGYNHPQAIFYVISIMFTVSIILLGNLRFKMIWD